MSFSEVNLKQRGRAAVDFMGCLLVSSATIRDAANKDIQAVAEKVGDLPDDLDERNQLMESELKHSRAFRVQQLLGEWYSHDHSTTSIEAFEEIQDDIQPELDRLSKGPSTIKTRPGFTAPAYWQGVEFHRTGGGWDGHPYMGFVHGEIIHRKMVSRVFGDIFKMRRAVAESAPKASYKHILDMGCSTGHFTQALAETYPDAEITGVDLSLKTLEHAQRVANSFAYAWQLIQASAEQTGQPDDKFDLVASYILLHEMPAEAVADTLREAFRVLAPGGDLLMSDVSRYADMNKLDEWRADRGATYGGEPHWRSSASADVGQIARDVGFVEVQAGGMNGGIYPYLVQAKKPS